MQALLRYFGVDPDARIGESVQASIFALDDARILRVPREETDEALVSRRKELLDELHEREDKVRFRFPRVLEVVEKEGCRATIEARIPGKPLSKVLADGVDDRKQMIRAYLEASLQIYELTPQREFYGDLLREDSIHTRSFQEYVIARAHDCLHRAGSPFSEVKIFEIADALPEAPKALVHMDYCPQNVMVDNTGVTGVLDFSEAMFIGDRRIDPVAAVAYLDPLLAPMITDDDRAFARTWLTNHQLDRLYEPFSRWLAAFWCAGNDASLKRWCRAVLQI